MAGSKPVNPLSDKFTGPVLRAYLVYGNEHGHIAKAVRRIISVALEGAPDQGDVVWLEGSATTAREVRSHAETIPFLHPRRVVVIQFAKELHADEQIPLADAVQRLPETACVIFEVRSNEKEHGLSRKLTTAIRAVGAAFQYAKMDARSNAVPAGMQRLAKEQGKTLSRSTCQYLLNRTGTDTELLKNEIAKLAAYVGDRSSITNADVDAMVARTLEESIFKLTDAVSSRQVTTALEVLDELLTQRLAPEVILAMLLRQFQLLRQAKFLAEKRLRPPAWEALPDDIAQRLPDSPNVVKATSGRKRWLRNKLTGQVLRLSWQHLNFAPQALLEADLQLKGADGQQRDRRLVMETLLCRLCPESPRSSGRR